MVKRAMVDSIPVLNLADDVNYYYLNLMTDC